MMPRFFKILSRAGLAAIFLCPATLPAQEMTPEERQEIESVIRDYLLKNPEVIRDAMRELRVREIAAERERIAKAVANRQGELLNDPASPVGGNPDGDVTIVEFFDYNCGYCKRVSPIVNAVLRRDRNVRLVYKEFAILGEDSVAAARAALAARNQGKYHEFHKELMEAPGVDSAAIEKTARKLGLDFKKLQADMISPDISRMLERNYRLAHDLGIEGTPAFVIGDRVVPGAINPAQFAQIIAAERARAKKN